nr:hypothetical protein CFP56_09697 [Quercus suber]
MSRGVLFNCAVFLARGRTLFDTDIQTQMADFISRKKFTGVRYVSSVNTQSPTTHSSHSQSRTRIRYTKTTSTSPGFQELSDNDTWSVESFPTVLPRRLLRRREFVEPDSILGAPFHGGGSFYRQRNTSRRPARPPSVVSPDQWEDQVYEYRRTNIPRIAERRPRSPHPTSTPLMPNDAEWTTRGSHRHRQSTSARSHTFVERDQYDADRPGSPWTRAYIPDMGVGQDESSSDMAASRRRRSHLRRKQSAEQRDVQKWREAWAHHGARVRSIRYTLDRATSSSMTSRDYSQLVDELRVHESLQQEAAYSWRLAEEDFNTTRNSYARLSSQVRPTRARHVQPERAGEAAYSSRAGRFFDSDLSFFPDQGFPSGFSDEPEELPQGTHDGTREGVPEKSSSGHQHDRPKRERRSHRHKEWTGRKETSRSRPESREHRSRSTAPLSTILGSKEVKPLFKRYNDEWQNLSSSDSKIPFPARGLQASALSDHRSLCSPDTTDKPSTWPRDTIVRANTQAFFLHAIGLMPQYTIEPNSDRILCGHDMARASDTQIKDLLAMLKKEKVRWHSDRIGRRNDGEPGLNEALQQDERVRAVFHAVCELMESVQAEGRS